MIRMFGPKYAFLPAGSVGALSVGSWWLWRKDRASTYFISMIYFTTLFHIPLRGDIGDWGGGERSDQGKIGLLSQ